MIPKLDAYDKKILELLLANAKESTTTIGRKIRLSRENVDYRLKRLINQHIITEFITEFNEEALHIKHHVLFAQLTRLTGDIEKELLQYLKTHDYISWVGTAAGKWTLIFDILIPPHTTLEKVITEFLLTFGLHVEEYALLELIQGKYYFEKCIGTKIENKQQKNKKNEIKLDAVDYHIMSLLNANARITYAELSQKIGRSANGIKNRIKDLERAGIIKGYTITLDFKKFNAELYGIQIKLNKFDREITKKLEIYLKEYPHVAFFYKYLGAWDYDIGLLANNSNELRNFINELRTKFPDSIKITDFFMTLEEIKGYHLPDGVFK